MNAVRFARDVSETGAPEEIRTPDPQIRSLVIYTAELPAQCASLVSNTQQSPSAPASLEIRLLTRSNLIRLIVTHR